MYKEEELSQELFQLEQVLKRTLFSSREFKNLKNKIKDMGLEMSVLLMVMAQDMHAKGQLAKKGRKGFKLSGQDKEFLKSHGMKW